MALQHSCHQAVDCTPDGCQLLKNGSAFGIVFKRLFESRCLPSDTSNTRKRLLLLFGAVWHEIPSRVVVFTYYTTQ
ncbi:UNVERIFIED_CONTAM: hypothetical protein LK11_22440 [Mumia flava]